MILREIKNIFIKNRLTEGVDFVRKEWLKADIPLGTTMMRLPVNSKNFEFKRNFIQLMNSFYFVTLDSNNNYVYHIADIDTDQNRYKPRIWNNTTSKTVYISSSNIGLGIHTIIANDDEVTISSTTSTASLPWYGEPVRIMFNNSSNINKNTIHLTSSIKVDGVTRYVPCQLLKSIPASLDANNIARQAGECGMYDSISGKFYGNVANSGTFTVEGDVEPETHTGLQQIYQNRLIEGVDYQTYDWLVQDENGGAYIDTKVNDLTDFSKIKVHYYVTGNPSRIFGREAINSVSGGQCLILINSDNTKTQLYCPKGYKFTNVDKDQTLYIDFDNQQATLNNTTVSVTLDRIVTSQTMKVFTRYPYEAKAGVKFAEVTFTTANEDILHLTPCQLLRSIPRNLDAQCKKRVAGECGMIDLISGKFYGNVASSGTFTVENGSNE